MDIDTLVIMGLLATALSWWFAIHFIEEKQLIKQRNKDWEDKLERAEKVKRLTNKREHSKPPSRDGRMG